MFVQAFRADTVLFGESIFIQEIQDVLCISPEFSIAIILELQCQILSHNFRFSKIWWTGCYTRLEIQSMSCDISKSLCVKFSMTSMQAFNSYENEKFRWKTYNVLYILYTDSEKNFMTWKHVCTCIVCPIFSKTTVCQLLSKIEPCGFRELFCETLKTANRNIRTPENENDPF